MANEQIIVDIKVEDKEINQAEKSIDRLTDSIEELGNRIKDARKQNKQYKKEQQALNEEYKQGKISTEQYEKGIDGLNTKIKTNNKVIAETSVKLSKQKGERTANIKLINSEKDSLRRLEAQASLLNKQISEQSRTTKEGRKEYARLEKELGKVNAKINEQRQEFNDNTRNVGNYTSSIKQAIKSNRLLGGAAKIGGKGVRVMGKALKSIMKIGILGLISLIVAALSAVGKAFSKSANGSKFLSKSMAVMNGLFSVLITVVNKFAGFLLKAFEDPQTAIKELWEVIQNNLLNRVTGLVELFKALWGAISGEDGALEKAAQALAKIATGMDETQVKEFVDELKGATDEANNMAAAFLRLEAAQRATRGALRSLDKDIAVLNAELEVLNETLGDDTRNMHEMAAASEQALKKNAELAKQQEKRAKLNLSLINQELALRRSTGEDVQDLLDRQAAAEVALTETRSQSAIAQQKILIEQRKIERDIFEQNLDILLDVGDRIKTEQEKQIQDESFSLEKRKQLLEASKAALAANFGEIKKEYELYGVTAEQINDVISASDAKQANEKLKALGLNEIANNRLREIILDRKQAELDFNDLSKTLSDEEITRKETANEKIKEINDESAISEIENAEELKKALIKIEEDKLELKLENENLLKEEREALVLESEQNIKEIQDQFTEEKIEKDAEDWEERKEILEESFNEIVDITRGFAGAEAALFGGISLGIIKAFEDGKLSAVSALNGIALVSDAVFGAMTARRAQEGRNNETARENELALVGDNLQAQAAINQKFDEKAKELKLKQFRADKAKALIDIAIATAVGAARALPNLILAGIITGFGVAQGIIVAAKKPPTFAQGTNDIVSIGGSHASGNDVDVFGVSGNQKQYFGKVEKGEAMPVIRKNAVNSYLVSKLNGKYSSGGRKFARGTNDITDNQGQGQNNGASAVEIASAIENITIVAKIEDITKQARKKVEIVDNSKV